MATDRIAQAWESYRRDVVPATASAVQVQECRRAFYAGAQGLLTALLTALDPATEPTERDLRLMDDVHTELLLFGLGVGHGS